MSKPVDGTATAAEVHEAPADTTPHIFVTGEPQPVPAFSPPSYLASTAGSQAGDVATGSQATQRTEPISPTHQPTNAPITHDAPRATTNDPNDYGFYPPAGLQPTNTNPGAPTLPGNYAQQYVQRGVENRRAIPLTALGIQPACVDCPRCGYRAMTRIEKHSSSQAAVAAVVLCLCLGILCAWIPFVMDSCKDTEHFCTNCGVQLAVAKQNGGVMVQYRGAPNEPPTKGNPLIPNPNNTTNSNPNMNTNTYANINTTAEMAPTDQARTAKFAPAGASEKPQLESLDQDQRPLELPGGAGSGLGDKGASGPSASSGAAHDAALGSAPVAP